MQQQSIQALISGGIAGVSVDLALFPLDTIKTRLQSSKGFFKSGGFHGMYRGIGSAAAGSFPNAALFFMVYESSKSKVQNSFDLSASQAALFSSALGEMSACLIRVPTENVKQKAQAGLHKSTKSSFLSILKDQGIRGFYTGYFITVFREIPFSMIQFPIWEGLKSFIRRRNSDGSISSFESAACGSFSGAFASALTTPLDVIKTRLMLGKDRHGKLYTGVLDTAKRIAAEEGYLAFLSGISARVMWIGIGGFVYFGAYEKSKQILNFDS
eukprot:maker-scaffold_12-snap-gene-7.51-mRNA-1 protein AED:0.01 eAED:0.01 QI:29/1/1/1/1/1/2/1238/269